MISQFPQIRDEESTYSIFARLQFALQPINLHFMGKLLFNKSCEVGKLNFQGSFDYLCNNLPSKLTPEDFFYNNTIYPLFIPFLSKLKQEKALEAFKCNSPDKINRYLTISNINGNRPYIRICKECIKEDFNYYGEPFYRRQHEIELNRMCYKHEIPLYEYTLSTHKTPRRYQDYCAVLSNSKEISIPKQFKQKFLYITDDINTVFTSNLSDWDLKITKNKIFNKIFEKGYLSMTGIKFQQEFCQNFKKYYSEDFLDYIGYNFDLNYQNNWLRKITRKNHDNDPLKFILVIRYLFGNFKEFYKYDKTFSTFKNGPYPCLNRVCPNYNKLVIKDIIKTTIYKNNPVATFKCEHCGFVYSRIGPDMNNIDIYNKTSIKDYGYLWHEKLKDYVDNGFSLKKINELLDCSDSKGIRSLVNKYKNPTSLKVCTIELSNEPNLLLLKQYRNQVISFIKQTSNATKTIIYLSNKIAYSYLLKNDYAWLMNNLKIAEKNKTISKEKRTRNYWLSKDKLLIKELKIAIRKIKSKETPYIRLTVYCLQNHVGYHSFNNNRNVLPKCSQILDEVCETILAYQKRRVNYIMKEMADNNIKISVIQVLRNAHLGTRANANQQILSYVEEMVKEHNYGNIIIEDTNN